MKNPQNAGYAFMALAISFFVIGLSTNKAFFAVAVAFLVVGIGLIAKNGKDLNNNK